MKQLIEYINEGNGYFTLNDSERNALSEFIGILIEYIGDDDEIVKYKLVKSELSDEEIKELEDLYQYVLDDDSSYPKVNRNVIKDELPILRKIIDIVDENNLIEGNWDLMDAFDKIRK